MTSVSRDRVHPVDRLETFLLLHVVFKSGLFLNQSRLLEGVQGLLGNIRSSLTSEPKLVSVMMPSFGCSRGYRLAGDGDGCGESVCGSEV